MSASRGDDSAPRVNGPPRRPSPERAGRWGLSGRVALALLRLASLLVPRPHRGEWLREWRSELGAWVGVGRSVLRPALGAFPHALWLACEGLVAGADGALRDARIAVRSLTRRPLFSLAVVLTMALGIGVTTSVYSVVDAVLLAPLPYPGSARFVRVGSSYGKSLHHLGLTASLLSEWRSRAGDFDAMEAYEVRDADLVGNGPPAVVREARVTSGFLSHLLGVPSLLGRTFRPGEDRPGSPPVALISQLLWHRRYGADTRVLGRTLRLNGEPYTVVGVAPTVAILPNVDVWTPYPMVPEISRTLLGSLTVVARMRPGVDLPTARKDVERAADEARNAMPAAQSRFTPEVTGYRGGLVSDVRGNLLLLLGAVAAVLLIASVNVANLLLARATERSAEMAVRAGLGASRGRILTQLLTEGLVLAAAGGVAGTAFVFLSVHRLMGLVPEDLPLAGTVGVDRRVILFVAALTLGTGIVFGLVPAARAARGPAAALASGGGSPGRAQRRTTFLLLGAQMAGTAVLLVGALLLLVSLHRMNTADTGFEPDGLLYVHLYLPDYAYGSADDPTSRERFLTELQGRLRATPGVRSVAIGTATPFSGMTFTVGMDQEGGRRPGSGDGRLSVPSRRDLVFFSQDRISSDYLSTLGLPVVRGRGLRPDDGRRGAAPVVLINATAARAYWPNEDAVGKRIRQAGYSDPQPWATVVGVVADFHHPGLEDSETAKVYWPLSAHSDQGERYPKLLVRFTGDPSTMVGRVRRAIWSVNPDLPIPQVGTARRALGAGIATPRFYSLLLATFAALAVLLACVGVYGVATHSVTRRTREMGIRIALGADGGAVRRQVLTESLTVVAPALVAGLGAALGLSRLLRSFLYGVTGTDPVTYAAAAFLMLAVAVAAVWIPASRATRADPVAALRAE